MISAKCAVRVAWCDVSLRVAGYCAGDVRGVICDARCAMRV